MRRRRAVGVIRLSKETDETTSPERQRAKITMWAELHDVEIVGWAVDIDVSAGIAPWDRPELGVWLRKTEAYDFLVVAKLDRLTRSLRDFVNLAHDLTDKGVALVAIQENMDLSTPTGRLIGHILAVFAEFERETIRERVKDAYDELVRSGRFPGGLPPYGYVPEVRTLPNGRRGVFLVVDEEQQRVILRIVSMICSGEKTPNAVADWLNAEAIPSPFDANEIRQGRPTTGTKWKGSNLIKLLRSRTLLGEFVGADKEGGKVRGDDGLAIQRAEPILDPETWAKLQSRLDSRKNRRSSEKNSADPLRGAFTCMSCGQPLYLSADSKRPQHAAYRHASGVKGCPNRTGLKLADAREALERSILAVLGNLPRMEKVINPGISVGPRLAQIEQAMSDLETDRYKRGLYQSESAAKRWQRMYAELEQEYERLSVMPARDTTAEWHPTGETFREWWAGKTWDERGQELRDHDVTLAFQYLPPKGEREPEFALRLGTLANAYSLATSGPAGELSPVDLLTMIGGQAEPSPVDVLVKIGTVRITDEDKEGNG